MSEDQQEIGEQAPVIGEEWATTTPGTRCVAGNWTTTE